MIDLHVHSSCSDGTLSPEEVAAEAAALGLEAVALTDHDTTAGVPAFVGACREHGVEGIAGVELSAEVGAAKGSMHILGYYIDPACKPLEAALESVRASRDTRNGRILELLEAEGVGVSAERVAHFAQGDVTGRLHVALALVEAGHVPHRDVAFSRYLAKGKRAYVGRYRLDPAACIGLIREAGGVPVLAHPGTLGLTPNKLREAVAELVSYGLMGLEVIYAHHNDQQLQRYRGLARTFGLCETGGTDYHGANTPDICMGRGFGGLRVPNALLEPLRSAAS